MILCNLALELEHLLEKEQVAQLTEGISDLILNKFYQEESGLVYENIAPNGTL